MRETKAQIETWELKDAAWKDVAHLPLAEAFVERRRASMQTVKELGLKDRMRETKAQIETWELKDAAWKDVAHLPLAEAFAERRRASMQTVKELGLEDRVRDPRRWKDTTVLPKTTQVSHN